ncbi:conserved hypothetical protein [Uncinocarpus reesii 1704]|uniref:Glycosyl transferase family protein n=1 Tax=Uncinocarpus reesii (strain UAMH 1704) TaxID=336963 RepID=C4JXK0_UNCRE|nr:uncharacterized protein UREG_06373 [Uncinocarpus reesii 1704]EEP81508.1 conserved hypothetical protein [Uncinocarpus reesii 1704]
MPVLTDARLVELRVWWLASAAKRAAKHHPEESKEAQIAVRRFSRPVYPVFLPCKRRASKQQRVDAPANRQPESSLGLVPNISSAYSTPSRSRNPAPAARSGNKMESRRKVRNQSKVNHDTKLWSLLSAFRLLRFGVWDRLSFSSFPFVGFYTRHDVWTTLITNADYLSGLLTLDYSLKRVGSKYPLLALYTDTFPAEGHAALDARRIPKRHIPYLLPSAHKDYSNDTRFYDCWSKLTPFSLVDYDRVVQLDSDMLVLRNMDELMDIELDDPALGGTGPRVFAASHACVCNPLHKPHYPKDWNSSNCAFTSQHSHPDKAQRQGAPPTAGLSIPNGGLQVVNPSMGVYDRILECLRNPRATSNYDFADQSLLADLFPGRWVAIPYTYNALKTLRWKGVHEAIWRDDEIKNIHYILSPKPWDETWRGDAANDEKAASRSVDETHAWWWKITEERYAEERRLGIPKDRF